MSTLSSVRHLAAASLAIVFAVASVLSACSLIPCAERRHDSGLLLVCPEPIEVYASMPEHLKGAASWAWRLAEENPDDLGYPWPDPATLELELRVA